MDSALKVVGAERVMNDGRLIEKENLNDKLSMMNYREAPFIIHH